MLLTVVQIWLLMLVPELPNHFMLLGSCGFGCSCTAFTSCCSVHLHLFMIMANVIESILCLTQKEHKVSLTNLR